jgi:hypothetical protein
LWSLPQGAQKQDVKDVQDAQSAQDQDAQTQDTPSQGVQAPAQRQKRIVTVAKPGMKPEGPDQISYEEWDILGREVGADCPRVKEFLRRLDARRKAQMPRYADPPISHG